MRVVVVGAGMAGLRSAEGLRRAGFGGEVTVVGSEPHMPYNRPPLSKDGIGAEFDTGPLAFRVARSAGDVGWQLGRSAVAADLTARTVTLADGTELGWDGLVIATGVRSRRLALPGPQAGLHVIRNLDDLAGLRADLGVARHVVVVGGGFIGSEVAAAARTRGLDVTVVEPEPLPMRRPLGDELAAELLRRHEERGVRFRLGTAPVAFEGSDRVRAVTLTDGTSLDADLVVESVGSVPNTEWLDGNGLDLADGVACDARLRVLAGGASSSAARDDVVAAGDVARYPHPLLFGASRRIEHWTVATDTARYAAALLARSLAGPVAGGGNAGDVFAAIPTFWSEQYEMRIQSFGVTGLPDVRILEGSLDGDVAVGYHRDGLLAGVVLIGLGDRYTHYRTLVAATIAALTQPESAAR
jgi:NADPH-dependent 2,4-dienoyl-CoA reductase/sulfur reductase-like enzyme